MQDVAQMWRSGHKLGCCASPLTLFEAGPLLFTAAYTRLPGPSASGESISACHLLVQALQMLVLLCPAFMCVLGIWTPVIRLHDLETRTK